MSKILVTGATGKIGQALVPMLLERGADVRAATRSPGSASSLAALGATAVRFDLGEPDTFRDALAGVDSLFVLAAPTALEPARVGALLAAAREAGVRSVVKVSSMGASADSPISLGRLHAASDQLVRHSGLTWTLVLPTVFMDNLVAYALESIRSHAAFFGAAQGGKVSFVSSRDIAAVSAAALLDPEGHAGRTYMLTGPEALSYAEVAALVSEVAGRTIRYVDVPPAQFRANLVGSGIPADLADSLLRLEERKADGSMATISPAVEQVLGRTGERYRDFLWRQRALIA